ncbi:YybH family protein [Methylorubrum populi]|uniref:YybH family protein n=1 Tax=Methylorubrum populi TaxID=223967 RepID=UPI003F65D374
MTATHTEDSAIRAVIGNWVSAVAANDIAAITEVYAEDGSILAAGAPPMQGHAAIAAFWDGLLKASAGTLTFGPTSIRVADGAAMACELGTYSFTTAANGSKTRNSGKYVVVWIKQNDGWKVLVDSLVRE